MRASSTCGRAAKSCGLDYAFIDSGDGPAIFIIMIAGAIVVGCGADRRDQIPAAVLAARRAVAAADSRDHAAADALDEVAADRAAVPSQGRGRPADRSRAEMTRDSATRRGVAGFGIFTLAMVALCVGLGVWQLQRRVEKHALIAALTERLAAAPGALPPPAQWSALTPARDEFRRVRFAATYQPASGCDGLQFRLGGARRHFRSRHLGVPAGDAARRRDRRDQCRLRAEHDAGPRASRIAR